MLRGNLAASFDGLLIKFSDMNCPKCGSHIVGKHPFKHIAQCQRKRKTPSHSGLTASGSAAASAAGKEEDSGCEEDFSYEEESDFIRLADGRGDISKTFADIQRQCAKDELLEGTPASRDPMIFATVVAAESLLLPERREAGDEEEDNDGEDHDDLPTLSGKSLTDELSPPVVAASAGASQPLPRVGGGGVSESAILDAALREAAQQRNVLQTARELQRLRLEDASNAALRYELRIGEWAIRNGLSARVFDELRHIWQTSPEAEVDTSKKVRSLREIRKLVVDMGEAVGIRPPVSVSAGAVHGETVMVSRLDLRSSVLKWLLDRRRLPGSFSAVLHQSHSSEHRSGYIGSIVDSPKGQQRVKALLEAVPQQPWWPREDERAKADGLNGLAVFPLVVASSQDDASIGSGRRSGSPFFFRLLSTIFANLCDPMNILVSGYGSMSPAGKKDSEENDERQISWQKQYSMFIHNAFLHWNNDGPLILDASEIPGIHASYHGWRVAVMKLRPGFLPLPPTILFKTHSATRCFKEKFKDAGGNTMTIQYFTHLSGTNQPISVPERTVPILGIQKNPLLPPGLAPKAAPFTAAEALAFTEKFLEELT